MNGAPSPIRVLLVEDDPADAELVRRELERSGMAMDFRVVMDRDAFEAALAEFRPAVVLSDHALKQFYGADALAILRRRAPDVPLILVTGSLGEERAVEYMKAGAADYVLKDRLARLGPAVHRAIERARLERELVQAQKLEAIGRLAGGVAHDFNNMLTAIMGHADLLLVDLPADAASRADVEEIVHAANRAASLTRQLLAFSRRQVLRPRPVHVARIVSDLTGMLRRLIGEDVTLRTALEPASGIVMADPGQLEQVVMNLVVNARDAMPKGGVVTVEVGDLAFDAPFAEDDVTVPPGRYVVLAVADTGVGMTPEVRAHVFEPFFTTKPAGVGTGLGLATVYGIVEQSGGRIRVTSAPGEGTAIRIYLPRAADDVRADPAPARAAGESLRGTETILVAEDEDAIRGVARKALSGYGYRVLAAASGDEALRLARETPGTLHLLVTDVVMPGMSGRELADRIRAERPGIRVLFLSGYTDDAIVRHGVLESSLHYLEKPFTPAVLARRVRQVLDSG